MRYTSRTNTATPSLLIRDLTSLVYLDEVYKVHYGALPDDFPEIMWQWEATITIIFEVHSSQ